MQNTDFTEKRDPLFRGFCEHPSGREEIVYSGRRVKGRWIEGGYAKIEPPPTCFEPDPVAPAKICVVAEEGFADWNMPRRYGLYEVSPETLAQDSGLSDIEGKPIFSHAICESRASEDPSEWKRWIVTFEDGSFCFEAKLGKKKRRIERNLLCKDEIILYGLVVIGNYWSNPELLCENKKDI